MAKPPGRHLGAWLCAGVSAAAFLAGAAPAWSEDDVAAQLHELRALVDAQAQQLEAQRKTLDQQKKTLDEQGRVLQSLKISTIPEASSPEPFSSGLSVPGEALDTVRGRGADGAAAGPAGQAPSGQAQSGQAQSGQAQTAQVDPSQGPSQPVGEAPPPSNSSKAAAAAVTPALPENLGVLTPRGHWVLEPQFEFLHASTNELVFRGVQIIPGLQLGLIDASTADRNTFSGAMDVRFGLSGRAEVELRVPYVFRHDQTQTLNQQATSQTLTETISNHDIGDIELTGRYQINSGKNGAPIWIAALDVKSDTGLGPFDVTYDKFGVAQQLSTGSGFWALEPSVSVLYPSDPVVLFASVGYIESIPTDVNKMIQPKVLVGRVEPGGSPTASIGFAFALNDRFSFSLGYKHSYIRPTNTEINGLWTQSLPLQIGVSTFGLSYRISPKLNLSNNFEFGVTKDAPDLHMLTRLTFYYF